MKKRVSTRLDVYLWICLPLAVVAAIAFYKPDIADRSAALVTVPSKTQAIHTFNLPVLSPSSPLSDSVAITQAAECMAKSGYDLRQWTSEDIQPVTGISPAPKSIFQRVDERSGYFVFENSKKPSHRVTVTLMQSDYSLKVIVSDSAAP